MARVAAQTRRSVIGLRPRPRPETITHTRPSEKENNRNNDAEGLGSRACLWEMRPPRSGWHRGKLASSSGHYRLRRPRLSVSQVDPRALLRPCWLCGLITVLPQRRANAGGVSDTGGGREGYASRRWGNQFRLSLAMFNHYLASLLPLFPIGAALNSTAWRRKSQYLTYLPVPRHLQQLLVLHYGSVTEKAKFRQATGMRKHHCR